MIGQTISHYRILEKLGAGGMGVVYKAEDTNLDRQVAIKVLPDIFSGDPERLVRFEREAKLLASLNHPNIAAIHGLEEAVGRRFLVLELVEGETLAERNSRGPVPAEEALPLARQLAEALEYAHERGVIHRDLKPGNIKITPDGKLKVLDFGLAKAFDVRPVTGDPAGSPTLTSPAMTQAGIIMGTAAYMSPEQARGAAVDKRTDIWAFGVVLFEMLTGRPCFPGDSVTDVLASVVKSEPDWALLPGDTPWRIRELLQRCLAKDRKKRLHDIADGQLEIEQAMASGLPGTSSPESGHGGSPVTAGAGRVSKTMTAAIVALVVLALASAAVAYWALTRSAAPGPVIHAAITPPEGHALFSSPAISPDGTTVAFV